MAATGFTIGVAVFGGDNLTSFAGSGFAFGTHNLSGLRRSFALGATAFLSAPPPLSATSTSSWEERTTCLIQTLLIQLSYARAA
jgi:hypothetical protein